MTGRRWGGRTRRGANEWHCNAVRGGAKNTYWHMGSDSQTGSETNTPASNQRGVIHASPGRNTHTYTLNHKLTHWIIKPIMLLPLLTVKLDYSTMNHSEFALAAFCILERSESNREQPLSTLRTNKPSCHIVTLYRRKMGKLLCTQRVEGLLWQILFLSLPHADMLLGQFAERSSPEEKKRLQLDFFSVCS